MFESLYLVGGRASIKEHCRYNPFFLSAKSHHDHDKNKFMLNMVRGVPGLSDAERKKLGLEKETLFGSAMGIFKSKMLTVVKISHGYAVSNNEVALDTASSASIPRAMDLHEATLMQGILAYATGTDALVHKAKATREKHNRFHNNR